MEEITFDDFFTEFIIPEQKFAAMFDPTTGELLSVGPDTAFKDCKNKIEIDQETAEMIIEGKITIQSCFVNIDSDELEFVESKTVIKIDDVLHRIPERKWANYDKIDLYIAYNSKNKTLKFQLSEEFQGTKKLPKKFQPVKARKVKWDGNTVMDFIISDYNDPNATHSTISFSLNELIGQDKIIKDMMLSNEYSIYTRRIFKNCVVEFK
jgi:hypothetical protein